MAVWGYEFYLLVRKVSLTRSLRSLVRDIGAAADFQHSKIKFVSPRGHVISSIKTKITLSDIYFREFPLHN